MDKPLVDAARVAAALSVKRTTVEKWFREGKIPGYRITAKVVRYDLDEVMAAVRSRVK